jgi:hypothetical protein
MLYALAFEEAAKDQRADAAAATLDLGAVVEGICRQWWCSRRVNRARP